MTKTAYKRFLEAMNASITAGLKAKRKKMDWLSKQVGYDVEEVLSGKVEMTIRQYVEILDILAN